MIGLTFTTVYDRNGSLTIGKCAFTSAVSPFGYANKKSLRTTIILIGQKAMGKNIKILLIEDNPGDAYLIEEYLEEFANFPYELIVVETLGEAICVLNKKHFDVILLDLELPDSYGINTFLSVHNKNPLIPIIILTGLNDEKVGNYAIKKGAYDFLVKGQTENRLLECILQCLVEHKKRLSPTADECYFQY